MPDEKVPYICGPLSDLPPELQTSARDLYAWSADECRNVLGQRAFVPHEHFDPKVHANFTPQQVDAAERRQVCELTSLLIVMAIAPSWGGGIEVEMANQSKVPVIVLYPKGTYVSRLLRGNPAVTKIIEYNDASDALKQLRTLLTEQRGGSP